MSGHTALFRERIVAAVRIEPLSDQLAKVAGEALARVSGATALDAIVMASVAQGGDIVYTSDVEDLEKLAGYFRAVRVLGIGCAQRRPPPRPTQAASLPLCRRPALESRPWQLRPARARLSS